jgi:hypothetical protein
VPKINLLYVFSNKPSVCGASKNVVLYVGP